MFSLLPVEKHLILWLSSKAQQVSVLSFLFLLIKNKWTVFIFSFFFVYQCRLLTLVHTRQVFWFYHQAPGRTTLRLPCDDVRYNVTLSGRDCWVGALVFFSSASKRPRGTSVTLRLSGKLALLLLYDGCVSSVVPPAGGRSSSSTKNTWVTPVPLRTSSLSNSRWWPCCVLTTRPAL